MTGQRIICQQPVYKAHRIEEIQNRPGSWSSQLIGIFEYFNGNCKQIGEFKRNYPSYTPFAPFIGQDGKWYALYSPHYTCTKIMSLPDCKEIGGEKPEGNGFCPVELYVPSYKKKRHWYDEHFKKLLTERDAKNAEYFDHYYSDRILEGGPEADAAEILETESEPFIYHDFGFVSGCVWGDDSGGWKVQMFNLLQAHEGKLSRAEVFGHMELPYGLPLRNAIWIDENDDNCTSFSLHIAKMEYHEVNNLLKKFEKS